MESRDVRSIRIDTTSTTPPFEQVRAHVAALVARGELPPGTRLPTVRALAVDLGLAVNTVARVYRELEADGVVVTHGRRGTFVTSEVTDAGSESEVATRAHAAATKYVRAVRVLGLQETEALRLVERGWRET